LTRHRLGALLIFPDKGFAGHFYSPAGARWRPPVTFLRHVVGTLEWFAAGVLSLNPLSRPMIPA